MEEILFKVNTLSAVSFPTEQNTFSSAPWSVRVLFGFSKKRIPNKCCLQEVVCR